MPYCTYCAISTLSYIGHTAYSMMKGLGLVWLVRRFVDETVYIEGDSRGGVLFYLGSGLGILYIDHTL